MSKSSHQNLSRRERQIMDVIYRMGGASAAEVYESLTDPPSDASVRKLIRILEEKGHLTHSRQGREYVYRPTVPRNRAMKAALTHLLDTFFEGSAAKAVTALLDRSEDAITEEDRERLSKLIDESTRKGE